MEKRNRLADAITVLVFILIASVGGSGCRTLPSASQGRETPQEVHKAVVSVSGAMAGHPLSEEEARRLQRQVVTDPEAQSAIKAITSSASAGPVDVKSKYCPVGGEHYAPNVEFCPVHHVTLKPVDQ
ncbi:MAG: hypothetical protein HZA29_01800 [Candidatus Omnitrophica bacterium]|nr:hypothetical protein [Candidatus Omnitrophota bacterium]